MRSENGRDQNSLGRSPVDDSLNMCEQKCVSTRS
jgi:hypothetical protein